MSLAIRNQALYDMSMMSLGGVTTQKLDYLGSIHVYGVQYFNIFRRYNSVYEIVIEDFYGDYHYHKDYTVRQSLQMILCLSDDKMEELYVIDAISYKHSAFLTNPQQVPSMRWSEIQAQWQGIKLDVGGILKDYPHTHTPLKEDMEAVPIVPNAPLRPRWKVENGQADELLGFKQSLSDRFAEAERKKRTWTQFSESDEEMSEDSEESQEEQSSDLSSEQGSEDGSEGEQSSEQESEGEQDSEESEGSEESEEIEYDDETEEYLVLRNGTKIHRK